MNITSRKARFGVHLLVFGLLAAACGGEPAPSSTTATEASTTTTTAAPATTTPPATTTAPTTTTVPATTTTAVPQETTTTVVSATTAPPNDTLLDPAITTAAEARLAPAVVLLESDWNTSIELDELDAGENDELYSACAADAIFAAADVDAATAGSANLNFSSLDSSAIAAEGDIEVRTFVDQAAAEDAWALFTAVFDTPTGIECASADLRDTLLESGPPDAVVEVTPETLDVLGADLAVRFTADLTGGGQALVLVFDVFATLDGTTAILGNLLSETTPLADSFADEVWSSVAG